ncbi:MAG: hypothetical protein G5Z42_05090 [Caldisphaeraceae archaeon]|nr:hypothetical protein [Caldisphaeraceae archaeon]MEB3798177.1 hypothetical protein [Caldisphaeraceae archaeon]
MTAVEGILKKALKDEISKEEALTLLKKVHNHDRLLNLMKVASRIRDEEIGAIVKLMGFIVVITPCTVNPPCKYCFKWADKRLFSVVDVLTDEELSSAIKAVEERGLKRAELGGGTWLGEEGHKATLHKLKVAKSASKRGIGIWVNNGPSFYPEDVKIMKEMGIEGVTCNLETLNEGTYKKLRPGLDMFLCKRIIEETERVGLGIDNTLLIGLGEKKKESCFYEDWVDFLFYFKRFRNLKIIEIHPFRPVRGSPLQDKPPGSEFETLKTIAIARLVLRKVNISGAHSTANILAGSNLIMHVYPVTKSFRSWNRHRIFYSKIIKLAGDAVMVDNFFDVTRSAREMGFEIEY